MHNFCYFLEEVGKNLRIIDELFEQESMDLNFPGFPSNY